MSGLCNEAPRIYRSGQHEQLMEAIHNSSPPECFRPDIIQDLVQFCQRDQRFNRTLNLVAPPIDLVIPPIDPVAPTVGLVMGPEHPGSLTCPFCPFFQCLSSFGNLERHVKMKHLGCIALNRCPSSNCSGTYDDIDHLTNHICLVHGVSL